MQNDAASDLDSQHCILGQLCRRPYSISVRNKRLVIFKVSDASSLDQFKTGTSGPVAKLLLVCIF
jgi:hypothetical protein